MAGGRFDKLAGKVRPGTYINFESKQHEMLGISERGTIILPLFNHNYGPSGEFIELATDAPDSKTEILGYSIYDNDANRQMLLIREAFKRAATIYVYRLNGGTKASGEAGGIMGEAKYPGTRGNDLTFTVSENPIFGYDLEISLGGSRVALMEGITTVEEMNGNSYLTFTAEDGVTTKTVSKTEYINYNGNSSDHPSEIGLYELVDGEYSLSTDTTYDSSKQYYKAETVSSEIAVLPVVAGVSLKGGTDQAATNGDVTAFLDKIESIRWNTLAFPVLDEALQSAAKTKIKYIRENVGRGVQVVMPNTKAGDYEGVINVTNSVKVSGDELSTAEACAWVAAVTAAATNTQSNTYVEYEGAEEVVNPKSHEQAVAAINNGEFFFSMSEAGTVVVEYDINTLVSFKDGKDSTYRKNRVIRVFDTFAEAVQLNFPPNKFSNSPEGWDIMEGIGNSILKQFEDAGAITDVDYDNDFLVDRSISEGDKTYFDVGLKAVDSAEKLYFTVTTR